MELAGAAMHKDLAAGLALLAAVQDDAVDLGRFNRQVVTHLRAAMLLQAGASERLALSEPEQEALSQLIKGRGRGRDRLGLEGVQRRRCTHRPVLVPAAGTGAGANRLGT